MKKITKAAMKEFNKKVLELLEVSGAIKEKNIGYDGFHWILNTSAGKMITRIDEDPSSVFSIFNEFEEPKRAKKFLELVGSPMGENFNIYSGKCNIHTYTHKGAIWQFETLLSDLQEICSIPV